MIIKYIQENNSFSIDKFHILFTKTRLNDINLITVT
jgi:hypothetical protein